MFEAFNDKFELSNGVHMPCLGFGTWQIPNDSTLENAISSAIQLGYRQFDTAQIYNNASSIGHAIQHSGISREEFFITSKVWTSNRSYDGVMESFRDTIEHLHTTYLDLLLIHWPAAQGEAMVWQSQNAGTWRALEELYDKGRVRAIGVSNFLPHHLVPLLARARIKPMVNQLELHPGYPQFSAVNFCFSHGIAVQAWSPMGRGLLLQHPLLKELARKYQVSTGQIALRWSLQHGLLPIAKALDVIHQKQNLDLFSFDIDTDDMMKLDNMPKTAFSGLHPDTVTF